MRETDDGKGRVRVPVVGHVLDGVCAREGVRAFGPVPEHTLPRRPHADDQHHHHGRRACSTVGHTAPSVAAARSNKGLFNVQSMLFILFTAMHWEHRWGNYFNFFKGKWQGRLTYREIKMKCCETTLNIMRQSWRTDKPHRVDLGVRGFYKAYKE